MLSIAFSSLFGTTIGIELILAAVLFGGALLYALVRWVIDSSTTRER